MKPMFGISLCMIVCACFACGPGDQVPNVVYEAGATESRMARNVPGRAQSPEVWYSALEPTSAPNQMHDNVLIELLTLEGFFWNDLSVVVAVCNQGTLAIEPWGLCIVSEKGKPLNKKPLAFICKTYDNCAAAKEDRNWWSTMNNLRGGLAEPDCDWETIGPGDSSLYIVASWSTREVNNGEICFFYIDPADSGVLKARVVDFTRTRY